MSIPTTNLSGGCNHLINNGIQLGDSYNEQTFTTSMSKHKQRLITPGVNFSR